MKKLFDWFNKTANKWFPDYFTYNSGKENDIDEMVDGIREIEELMSSFVFSTGSGGSSVGPVGLQGNIGSIGAQGVQGPIGRTLKQIFNELRAGFYKSDIFYPRSSDILEEPLVLENDLAWRLFSKYEEDDD